MKPYTKFVRSNVCLACGDDAKKCFCGRSHGVDCITGCGCGRSHGVDDRNGEGTGRMEEWLMDRMEWI